MQVYFSQIFVEQPQKIDLKKIENLRLERGAGMNLSMKGSSISMSLAESTNVQVYISQVFVGQGQQMDVFWKMQETAFSRKTIVSSTPQDRTNNLKILSLKISCGYYVEHYEEEDQDGGLTHKGQSDHLTVLHQVICSIHSS